LPEPEYLRARMKTLLLLGLLSSPSLFGCVRRAETNVAGSDEEMIDRYTTRLEELVVRLQAEHPECAEVCSMNQEGCDLARKICEIAARQPDRLEGRCAFAQEECAKLGDACISCRR
jgi:hypothetical protein